MTADAMAQSQAEKSKRQAGEELGSHLAPFAGRFVRVGKQR